MNGTFKKGKESMRSTDAKKSKDIQKSKGKTITKIIELIDLLFYLNVCIFINLSNNCKLKGESESVFWEELS